MPGQELKPCPFCGGRAKVRFRGDMLAGYWKEPNWKGVIVADCVTCGASTKGMFYQGPPITVKIADTIGGEAATEAWNRRA